MVGVSIVAEEVTERRAAERALAESEARFREMADNAPVMVWVTDPTGSCTFLSRSWYEFTGQTPETGLGLGWLEATHPEDRDQAQGIFLAATARQEAFRIEYRLRRTDGAYRWAIDAAVPRFGPDGGFLGYIGSVIDITERKAAEAALAEGEARLRRVQRIGRVGGFEINLRTGLNRRSAEYMKLQGRAAEAAVERHADWVRRLHPEDRERAERRFLEATADGAPDTEYAQEYRIVTPAGEVRSISARAEIERDAGGRALRMLGAHVDVTELKAAEAALAEGEARWRTLAESHPGFAFETDAEGRNTYTNRRFQDYTGLPAEALLGAGWLAALHPGDRARAAATWDEAVRTGGPYEAEYRFRAADGGYRWFLCRGTPQRAADGAILRWHGAIVDITEIVAAREGAARQAEVLEARVAERTRALSDAAQELAAEMRRREAAQSALLQSQKLEALGQLTGGVAHDFNNILAAVTGSYRLIERRVEDPKVVELIRHGERAAERARRLIRQLLAFARKERLSPAALDPAEALHEAEDLICHAAGSRLRCRLEAPPGLWPVLADPHQLEIALLNLVVNARDAMPQGGDLTIAVRNLAAAERPPGLRPGDYVGIAVRDGGEGMAPEVLARATEPFFTTKPQGKGTGLGLSMVHGFAEQSGGGLRIESRPGEGTTVEIVLPRAALEAQAPGRNGEAVPDQGRHGGATVLLVEDDDQVRPVTAGFLRELGYTVAEAANAEAAGALVHTLERLDLVVTDVAMPGADGPTLAARLRAERPGLPFLFVTGHPPGPALAGEAVLRKPYTGAEFGAAVLERLGRRPPPPSAADRLLARLRRPALRELYLAWGAARAAAGEALPPPGGALDPARFGLADSAFTVAVDAAGEPPGFRPFSAGPAVAGRLEGELAATAGSEGQEVLGTLEGAYRRCLRSQAPVYQAARLDFGDGSPLHAERLLLPLSDNGQTVTCLLGIMLSDAPRTERMEGGAGRE